MREALVVDKARPPTHPDAVAPSSLAVLIHPAVDDDRAVSAHAPVAPLGGPALVSANHTPGTRQGPGPNEGTS